MTEYTIQTASVYFVKNIMHYIEKNTICLIDVREPEEWNQMHIPGAIHIPKDKLTSHSKTLLPDINQPIYLYCQAGIRSLYAAQILLAMGYKEVYSVEGGIIEWSKLGYPLNILNS